MRHFKFLNQTLFYRFELRSIFVDSDNIPEMLDKYREVVNKFYEATKMGDEELERLSEDGEVQFGHFDIEFGGDRTEGFE